MNHSYQLLKKNLHTVSKNVTTLLAVVILQSTFLILHSYAVSYTWNGATSTAWGTSTNWTPNGVPGAADNVTIVTATNQPTYNGVAGVTAFTMTSGTLNLNGYTLTISSTANFSGGTINNGKINVNNTGTMTVAGTVFNCKFTSQSNNIYLNGSTFNDTTRITRKSTGSGNNLSVGGNKFYAYTEITNQAPANIYLNHSSPYNPDTATNVVVFNQESAGHLAFGGNNSVPSVFYDKVIMNKKSGSNGVDLIGGWYGKVEFHDTVEVSNVSNRHIYLGYHTNSEATLTEDATIVIGSAGFSNGNLYFRHWDKQNSTPINITLTGTAKWEALSDNIINGNLTVSAPQISTIQSIYNGNITLTKTGSTDNWMGGDNVFNGEFTLTNNSSAAIGFGTGTIPDTFRLKATFITYNNNISVAHAYSGHYFGGDVYFKTLGTGAINVSNYGAGSFAGNIYLTSTSTGAINFGQSTSGTLTLASGKTIIEDTGGFNSGSLLLRRFVKNGTTVMNLDFGTSAGVTFGPYTTINGSVTYSGGEFYLNGTTFNHTVNFTKKGSVNATSSGGNVFNGAATFNSNGTGTLTLANTTGDDFNDDVTFIKTANKNFYPANVGTNTFAGDITFSGAYTGIAFGKSTGLAVLDGGSSQVFISRSGEAAKKLKIAKSANNVLLDGELTVSDSLILTNGILKTEGSDMVVLEDNCKLGGVSDASFVDGKVKKIGNDAFTFPVGRNGHYRKIGISAPAVTTDAFTAEYFNKTSNDLYSHSSKDGSIAGLSRSEYWKLDRNTGTSNISVTLSWDTVTTSCSFASATNLKVSSWDGSTWKDRGNGGTTGNLAAGTIVTNGTSTTYGAYTLATTASFNCKPGVSCADVIALNTGDTCLTNVHMVGEEMWYSFVADSANMEITLENLSIPGYTVYTEVYAHCDTTLSIKDTLLYNMTSATIDLNNLTVTEPYILKLWTRDANTNIELCIQPRLSGFFEIYNNEACGLNFVQVSARLNQRENPDTPTGPGESLPITLTVPEIPDGAIIDKAFIWLTGIGTHDLATHTPDPFLYGSLTNTNNFTSLIKPSLVASTTTNNAICWSPDHFNEDEQNTFTYYKDITSLIYNNDPDGNYVFHYNQLLEDQFDFNGVTLMIIYKSCENGADRKRLNIYHGIYVKTGLGEFTYDMILNPLPFNENDSETMFMIVSDIEKNGSVWNTNPPRNSGSNSISGNMYNYLSAPVNVSGIDGDTFVTFNVDPETDECYAVSVMGIIYANRDNSCTILNVSTNNDVSICKGFSTNLSASETGGNPNYTYSWTPTTGLSNPNISNPVANPIQTTTYTVTVTDATGCTATDQVVVTVNEAPPVPVISGDIFECTTNLTYTVSNPDPYATYAWSAGSGTTTFTPSTGTTSVLTLDGHGGTFNVTATDGRTGCQSVGTFTYFLVY